MKLYIDENIPYAKQFFSDFGDLTFFSGRTVSPEQLSDADILLVRSITQVNEGLLHLNKTLKFVGTATIGMDHVDQDFLKQHDIAFSSSPGCNKISVAEYVLSSLLILAEKQQFQLTDKSVAIVGAGNTGSAVYERLTALGVCCKLYDPPLQLAGDKREFCRFDDVLNADIISLHVPKIHGGAFPTVHMFDASVLAKLNDQQILINASRGEVIDNQALLTLARNGHQPTLVLDVWENEPNIEKQLLPYVEIATPHIAGYSLDGRARGTEMLYQALCLHLNKKVQYQAADFVVKAAITDITITQELSQAVLKQLVHLIYDVRRDDALFRQMIDQDDGFDIMRKTYSERRELSTLTVNTSTSQTKLLQSLGFNSNNLQER
ncbi:4-phosphoerythronate dehydrogenase [Psychromonas sp. Urea-02u-13]|uniref:4-phosphoerythronate dehydrogenase n=1 Tax=Psychromonas sp. Urea-02u-13 TaxID=2058326 RepID=UPI000C31DE69|nr:4-phosphoerythronate dehydrogenase [Psychromonas sp. Urea-02u-13]PKG39584.1 4-phosphoerythronate dehydrogenase [Psychromonas sp. Urea-02u-13]